MHADVHLAQFVHNNINCAHVQFDVYAIKMI